MRKFVISIFVFTFALIPLLVSAQNWSPEEKLILEKVRLEKTAWENAVNNNDWSIWLKAAEPAEDWQSWWTSDGSLWTLEDSKRNFEFFIKDESKTHWVNLNPIGIKVHNDVAYIWYYNIFGSKDKHGKITTSEVKRFDVYRKIDGNWRLSATMVDRYPIEF